MMYAFYVAAALALFLTAAAVAFTVKELSARKRERPTLRSFTVSNGIAVIICAYIIVALFFGITASAFFFGKDGYISGFVAALATAGFSVVAFMAVREKTTVTDDAIVHTPPLGNRRQYRFCDIKRVKVTQNTRNTVYAVYGEKRLFKLFSNQKGSEVFMRRAAKEKIATEYRDNVPWK